MHIKKTLLLLLTVVLVFSCIPEEESDQNTVSSDITHYDTSNLGFYIGTFTTLDGSERGMVELEVLDNVPSRASLILNSGAEYALQSTSVATSGKDTNLSFMSVAGSNVSVTFDLSVNADGTNTTITNTTLGSKASDIFVVKQTSRGPVVPISGTFACDECGTHPTLGTGPQTFNMIFVSDPTGQGESTMGTQYTLDGVVRSSLDNSQDGASCTPNGAFTSCDLSGSIGSVTWMGAHTYNNTATDCSEVSGSWTHPGWGGISGTFVSDIQCEPSVPAAAIGDLIDGGVVFYVASTPIDLDGDGTLDNGLVCALSDYVISNGTIVEWGCLGLNLSIPNVPFNGGNPVGPGAEIGDGGTNTNGILATTQCTSPAALAARSLGPEWFLPSINEVNQMFVHRVAINTTALNNGGTAFQNDIYWSSTENDLNFVWTQDLSFVGGGRGPDSKNTGNIVRAVRAF